MSAELLKRLGLALGVLLLLWGGVELFRKDIGNGVTEFSIPAVKRQEIDSIVIRRPLGDITLVKQHDSIWSVNGFRASPSAVNEVFEAIAEPLRAELVAETRGTHARFSIDSAQARRLQLYRGADVAVDLLVGKRGRDFQAVYLRRPNEDEVYSARTKLVTFADRPVTDWRDKQIANVPADSISAIDVIRGVSGYTLTRADSGQWKVDGSPADSGEVARLLSQFQDLNATGFPTDVQMDSVDFENAERRVLLKTVAARDLAELVFDSTTFGFWVKRTGDSTVYRLERYKVDQLTPADSTIRK
jgi:Domain of unknown function (DUF4340)